MIKLRKVDQINEIHQNREIVRENGMLKKKNIPLLPNMIKICQSLINYDVYYHKRNMNKYYMEIHFNLN